MIQFLIIMNIKNSEIRKGVAVTYLLNVESCFNLQWNADCSNLQGETKIG